MSSRALNRAQSAVVDAERDRDRWTVAVAEAEVAAAAALQVDVSDPSELDAAGERAARTASKVAAARRALARVEDRLAETRRSVLLVEADDEDAAAAAAERELTTLQGKVEALLAQLEALNNVRYELPDDERVSRLVAMGERVEMRTPRTSTLATEVRVHRIRAAVLRTTARTGRVPGFIHELDELIPGVWGSSLIDPAVVPPSARAYAAVREADLTGVAAE